MKVLRKQLNIAKSTSKVTRRFEKYLDQDPHLLFAPGFCLHIHRMGSPYARGNADNVESPCEIAHCLECTVDVGWDGHGFSLRCLPNLLTLLSYTDSIFKCYIFYLLIEFRTMGSRHNSHLPFRVHILQISIAKLMSQLVIKKYSKFAVSDSLIP